jgi:RNA polymerase sigma-70 factor (ECF subfamily)
VALEAIKSLSDRDKSALLKVARTYARTRQTRYDYEDLLHEAITRVLEGGRKWPTAVPFMAFMCGVMRGIAWDWRGEVQNADPEEATGPAEGDAIASIDAQKLVALFDDDPIAQKLIIGMMEGARGEELWEASGLTKTDYESKRKKIRRRIERLWLK